MLSIYLTLASINYMTQFILMALITGYLFRLTRRGYRRRQLAAHVWLLAGFFAATTIFTPLNFLDVIPKPFEVKTLARAIRGALSAARAGR